MMSPWGLLLFSAYLPIQKDPRCTRVWNLPVDVQIIQRAGVGVADMLVDIQCRPRSLCVTSKLPTVVCAVPRRITR
jgi:hypothetical protein